MLFKVTKKAQRPADMNGKCFYCQQSIGSYHKFDCVLINKRVKIRLTVDYEINVPVGWRKEMIEFHRNDGTWCSDNLVKELQEIITTDTCLCPLTNFEYLETTGEPKLKE